MIKNSYTATAIKWRDTICLIEKNSGFHSGRLNLIGGKVEPTERQEDAAVREIKEETGLELQSLDLKYEGRISSQINDFVPDIIYLYSITISKEWDIELKESKEGHVAWYGFNVVCDPYLKEKVVPDLPFVLHNMFSNRICYYDMLYTNAYGLEKLKMELMF